MPAQRRTSGPKAVRTEPYTKDAPNRTKKAATSYNNAPENWQEKENVNPSKKSSKTKAKDDTPKPWPNYRAVPLNEVKGEVPCHDNCTAIRRKLQKLLDSKSHIPGTTTAWSKASLSAQMKLIADDHHAIDSSRTTGSAGPSVASITNFLKKTGSMGGGDSETYYFGNMLLEKLRIWNGEKKSKAELKAEEEFPTGHVRLDPKTARFFCGPGLPRPTQGEVARAKRGE